MSTLTGTATPVRNSPGVDSQPFHWPKDRDAGLIDGEGLCGEDGPVVSRTLLVSCPECIRILKEKGKYE